MGIFTDNPVLERELRGRLHLRSKGQIKANRWIGWLVGLFVAYYYLRSLVGIWRGTAQDAHDLYPLVAYGALVLIVLLAPALAATAISQEREQQTWDNLTTTELSAAEVLFGKWLGRQLIPCLLLIVLLPLMAVCVFRASFGGIVLLVELIFLLLTSLCYGALGLLCSFLSRRTATATAVALTFSAFLSIGTVVIDYVLNLLRSGGLSGAPSAVLWINPFFALSVLIDSLQSISARGTITNQAAIFCYFLFIALATIGSLAFMVRRYRDAVRERS